MHHIIFELLKQIGFKLSESVGFASVYFRDCQAPMQCVKGCCCLRVFGPARALQTEAAPMKEPMQCIKEYASLRAIEHTRTLDTDSTLMIANFLGLYISDTKWLSSDGRDVTWWTQVSSECCFVSKGWVLDGWVLDDASWNDLVQGFPEVLEDPGYAL